jgi:SMI1 / KNR4 family (SUKH-1)
MNSNKKVEQLLQHLRDNNVLFRLGLTADILNRFESQFEISIPSAFKNFLFSTDGTALFEEASWEHADREGYCFYSFDKKNLLPSRHLIFCEWLLGLNQYAISLSENKDNGKIYHLIDNKHACEIAGSFDDFIDLYLQQSRLLINPSPIPIISL